MKKYPTSKEILESCDGNKHEACQMVIQNIIEILKNVDETKINDILPENFDERISKIEHELGELTNTTKRNE
jgi:hypothetical protein